MTSYMEKFLGVKIGRDNIPGSVSIKGKEFIYFEDDKRNTFKDQFHAIINNVKSRISNEGGMVEEGCKIWLPDGRLFHAISYHGDLEGWKNDIESGATASNVQLATIQGDKIVLYDGKSFLLAHCKIVDEEKRTTNL